VNDFGSCHGFFENKVAVFYLIEAAVEIRTHYLSKRTNTWTAYTTMAP
jgi:hypothetical protein